MLPQGHAPLDKDTPERTCIYATTLQAIERTPYTPKSPLVSLYNKK